MYTIFIFTNNVNQKSFISYTSKSPEIYVRDMQTMSKRPPSINDGLFMLDLKQLGFESFTVNQEEGFLTKDDASKRKDELVHILDAKTTGYHQRRKKYERMDVEMYFILMFCERQTGELTFHVTKEPRRIIKSIRERHTDTPALKHLEQISGLMLGIEIVRVFPTEVEAENALANIYALLASRPELKQANERALQQFLAKWCVELESTQLLAEYASKSPNTSVDE